MEGIPLNLPALKKAGISPTKAAHLVNDIFFQQIFKYGFVHSDPHLGEIYFVFHFF